MRNATTKWFDNGYGFLVDSETKEDVFVHYSNLIMDGYKSLHENDMVTLVDAIIPDNTKNLVPLMMYVTPGMVITLIERMLGGGEEVVKVKDGYRYSDVEIALYKRVLSYLIQALKDGFSNYINIICFLLWSIWNSNTA